VSPSRSSVTGIGNLGIQSGDTLKNPTGVDFLIVWDFIDSQNVTLSRRSSPSTWPSSTSSTRTP